VKRSSNNRLPL